jgi:hypothetical protein
VQLATNFRIGCWTNDKIFTIVVKQPGPQLFDYCTCSTILFFPMALIINQENSATLV